MSNNYAANPLSTLRIPCPDDRVDGLLGSKIGHAWREVLRLRASLNDAYGALARADAAVADAEAKDVAVLADAIRFAEADEPELTHAAAARQAVADANRRVDATAKAALDATQILVQLLDGSDRAALVAALDAQADLEAQAVRAAAADARAHRDEVRMLRDVSAFAANAPKSWGGADSTMDQWPQVLRLIDVDLDALARPFQSSFGAA